MPAASRRWAPSAAEPCSVARSALGAAALVARCRLDKGGSCGSGGSGGAALGRLGRGTAGAGCSSVSGTGCALRRGAQRPELLCGAARASHAQRPESSSEHSRERRRGDGVCRKRRSCAAVVRCVALSSAGSSSSPSARAENAGSTSYLAACKILAKKQEKQKVARRLNRTCMSSFGIICY